MIRIWCSRWWSFDHGALAKIRWDLQHLEMKKSRLLSGVVWCRHLCAETLSVSLFPLIVVWSITNENLLALFSSSTFMFIPGVSETGNFVTGNREWRLPDCCIPRHILNPQKWQDDEILLLVEGSRRNTEQSEISGQDTDRRINANQQDMTIFIKSIKSLLLKSWRTMSSRSVSSFSFRLPTLSFVSTFQKIEPVEMQETTKWSTWWRNDPGNTPPIPQKSSSGPQIGNWWCCWLTFDEESGSHTRYLFLWLSSFRQSQQSCEQISMKWLSTRSSPFAYEYDDHLLNKISKDENL